MLKRFSRNIEENLEKLEHDIALLKKKFPGKFPETLEPDSLLSRIRDIAITLKGDNADIEAKCRSGELGNELTLRATELKAIMKDILDALRGKISGYTIIDRFAYYGGKVKSFLLGLSLLVSNTGRIILAAILVIILSFVYLSLTMESEDVLLKSIKNDFAYIEKQKDILAKQNQEYKETREKIKPFDQAIETREKKIAEKNKKVEEIRKKSFFQKLLRR